MYGLYEFGIMRPWMARVGEPIRADLFFIAPLLYASIVAGLIPWVFTGAYGKPVKRSRWLTAVGWGLISIGGWRTWFNVIGIAGIAANLGRLSAVGSESWRKWFIVMHMGLGFAVSVGYVLGGIGTLRLQAWARTLVIVLAAISTLGVVIQLSVYLFMSGAAQSLRDMLVIGLAQGPVLLWYGLLGWFFTRPSVRAHFHAARSAGVQP